MSDPKPSTAGRAQRWWQRRRTPSESEIWGMSLPPTPLNRHLVSLHALLMHLRAEGDVRAVAEHHLWEIGVFTVVDPLHGRPAPVTLAREAEWLKTAHANSADKGYTAEFRAGFACAAGWVRWHAKHGHPAGGIPLPTEGVTG